MQTYKVAARLNSGMLTIYSDNTSELEGARSSNLSGRRGVCPSHARPARAITNRT
jgi:hypothetical protein